MSLPHIRCCVLRVPSSAGLAPLLVASSVIPVPVSATPLLCNALCSASSRPRRPQLTTHPQSASHPRKSRSSGASGMTCPVCSRSDAGASIQVTALAGHLDRVEKLAGVRACKTASTSILLRAGSPGALRSSEDMATVIYSQAQPIRTIPGGRFRSLLGYVAAQPALLSHCSAPRPSEYTPHRPNGNAACGIALLADGKSEGARKVRAQLLRLWLEERPSDAASLVFEKKPELYTRFFGQPHTHTHTDTHTHTHLPSSHCARKALAITGVDRRREARWWCGGVVV